ncbi:MAG: hypothetical protein AB1898_13845 [Acidobacteriota bacterium]
MMNGAMGIGLLGLAVLGALNIVLGVLIAVLSFRLSVLNQATAKLESRISRLEVLIDLSHTRQSRESQEAV